MVSLGINDGYPIRTADGQRLRCCSERWVGIYTRRVRTMMRSWTRYGGQVAWMTLPPTAVPELVPLLAAVNTAVLRASVGLPRVSVVRVDQLVSPDGRYTPTKVVGGGAWLYLSDRLHLAPAGTPSPPGRWRPRCAVTAAVPPALRRPGRGLPVDPVRDLPADRARGFVGADAAAEAVEALHLGRELRLHAAASIGYCLLLAAMTVANQVGAIMVQRAIDAGDPTKGRRFVIATVAFDLGVLGVFKYYGFFVNDIGGFLESIGLGLPLPLLTLALPIGLSFITFQAISYTVDVRRELIRPASLLDFGIYLSFFPHLVAGPIVRAWEFLPQLRTPREPARSWPWESAWRWSCSGCSRKWLSRTSSRAGGRSGVLRPGGYRAPDAVFAATRGRRKCTATSPATPTSRSDPQE